MLFLACAPAPGTVDAGPARGTPGAQVWSETSARLQVSQTLFFDGLFGGPPSTFYSCASLPRSALSQEQEAFLESLTLAPRMKSSVVDGFSCDELIVFDDDGGSAAYGSIECDVAKPDAGSVMIPEVWYEFSGTDAGCP
jgi:hypothetical protein